MTKPDEYYEEIKPRSNFSLGIQELIRYKELFYFFTWRDVKVKYKQTIVGILWAVVQPTVMVILFTFFVGNLVQIPTDTISYPIFAYSGLMLWMLFASAITNAGNSMVTNAQILKKVYFPRLIIPISSVLAACVDFLFAFALFIFLLLGFDQQVNVPAALIFWPLGILLTILSALGPGCLLAALNVKYRDFRYVIPFLVQTLLFVTPVIYPVSAVSNQWMKYALAMNPMYAAITLFRWPMMEVQDDPVLLGISIVSELVFLLWGVAYFRKTEIHFADLA